MKKQLVTILLGALTAVSVAQASYVSDIENLGLSGGQVYNGSSGGSGFQGSHVFFPTVWDTAWGGFWSSGWAASAVYDSSTAGFTNLYGCIAYKGYNNSNTFAVGGIFGDLKIKLTDSLVGKTVSGFYVCNSTYAYKSIKYGDGFAKAFGDTTGTGCGCMQGTYPDWFKLTVKKYFGGALQQDSVEVYLADYRFANSAQDYILKNWTWINLSALGSVDSLWFGLRSSDNGSFGMNTPAYFCLDNLTLLNVTGIGEHDPAEGLAVWPNPASNEAELAFTIQAGGPAYVQLVDALGRAAFSEYVNASVGLNKVRISLAGLANGVYYIHVRLEGQSMIKKLIKY